MMEKLKMHSLDKINDNIMKIGEIFPDCLTECINENGEVVRAIDFDVLRQELSKDIVEGNMERYQFVWPDKKKYAREANRPTTSTLRPCKEESVDFDNTQNLYIEGDNLEVLKLLQETYLGKIKMIYIDPPYNTGNDFIYKDNFDMNSLDYLAISGQYDEVGNRLVQNLETSGRFHTNWLNFMYPRLKLARNLLKEDGIIFISIGVEELVNLKAMCNEIFGENNFIEVFSWVKTSTPPSLSTKSRKTNEYILCYEKNKSGIKYNGEPLVDGDQPLLNTGNGETVLSFPKEKVYFKENKFPNGIYEAYASDKVALLDKIEIKDGYATTDFRLKGEFKWSQEFLEQEILSGTTFIIKSELLSVRFIRTGEGYKRPTNFIKDYYVTPKIDKINNGVGTNENASAELKKIMDDIDVFPYPKPVSLIKYLLNFVCEDDDIVMDFFSGSATTAEAVFDYNNDRKKRLNFILVQLQENLDQVIERVDTKNRNIILNSISFLEKYGKKHLITELAKERIRRAGKKIKDENPLTTQDLDVGFRVLKCDSSNMKDVYYTPNEYTTTLIKEMEDNIKDDRTAEDLLFQVLLDMGVLLSSKIEVVDVYGKKVFKVEDNTLIACFDKSLTDEVITEIAKMQPIYFVMRDSSIANDSVAANFKEIFKTYNPFLKKWSVL